MHRFKRFDASHLTDGVPNRGTTWPIPKHVFFRPAAEVRCACHRGQPARLAMVSVQPIDSVQSRQKQTRQGLPWRVHATFSTDNQPGASADPHPGWNMIG